MEWHDIHIADAYVKILEPLVYWYTIPKTAKTNIASP
jgi:hypothetical protein